jgi:Uma2 family endonuclease
MMAQDSTNIPQICRVAYAEARQSRRIAQVQTKISVDQKAGLAPAEQRLTLHDVSWETYDKLLEAFGEHRAVRFTYDQGVLEFMVPLEAHENPSDLIGVFIRTLAVESGANIKGLASTTLRRRELARGAEPDKCYYIKNEPLVRGRTVDLEQDPPPDLVAEIDITHTDIDKNALYAELGIPEFWRFDGQELKIYQSQDGLYQEESVSPTFPWAAKEVFYNFLEQCRSIGEAQAQRELGVWVQSLTEQE